MIRLTDRVSGETRAQRDAEREDEDDANTACLFQQAASPTSPIVLSPMVQQNASRQAPPAPADPPDSPPQSQSPCQHRVGGGERRADAGLQPRARPMRGNESLISPSPLAQISHRCCHTCCERDADGAYRPTAPRDDGAVGGGGSSDGEVGEVQPQDAANAFMADSDSDASEQQEDDQPAWLFPRSAVAPAGMSGLGLSLLPNEQPTRVQTVSVLGFVERSDRAHACFYFLGDGWQNKSDADREFEREMWRPSAQLRLFSATLAVQ